jgi:hypothetical protein
MFTHCLPAYGVAVRFGLFRFFTAYHKWQQEGYKSTPDDVIYSEKLHGWVLRFRTPARKCMAMALHPRLGEACKLNTLPVNTIKLILDFHCPVDVDMDDKTLLRLMLTA